MKVNLINVITGFGFIIKTNLLILLVLTICTCSGPRLMLGHQTFESQIDYSSFSGKLAKQIHDPLGCVILKTEDLGFLSWRQERWLIWQPYQVTVGMVYYPSLGLMQSPCSLIKLYPYRLITLSFSNRYKTVWTGLKPNLPTVYQQVNSQGVNSLQMKPRRTYKVSTPRLTGKTQATTRTMVRSLNYSSTMKAVNGKSRTTSSTTGGLQKRR